MHGCTLRVGTLRMTYTFPSRTYRFATDSQHGLPCVVRALNERTVRRISARRHVRERPRVSRNSARNTRRARRRSANGTSHRGRARLPPDGPTTSRGGARAGSVRCTRPGPCTDVPMAPSWHPRSERALLHEAAPACQVPCIRHACHTSGRHRSTPRRALRGPASGRRPCRPWPAPVFVLDAEPRGKGGAGSRCPWLGPPLQ